MTPLLSEGRPFCSLTYSDYIALVELEMAMTFEADRQTRIGILSQLRRIREDGMKRAVPVL